MSGKDVGQKLKEQKRMAVDKERPQAPIRLPHKKQVGFKLPKRGLPDKEEAYSQRKVTLVNPKLFRNLYRPETREVQGTLNLS